MGGSREMLRGGAVAAGLLQSPASSAQYDIGGSQGSALSALSTLTRAPDLVRRQLCNHCRLPLRAPQSWPAQHQAAPAAPTWYADSCATVRQTPPNDPQSFPEQASRPAHLVRRQLRKRAPLAVAVARVRQQRRGAQHVGLRGRGSREGARGRREGLGCGMGAAGGLESGQVDGGQVSKPHPGCLPAQPSQPARHPQSPQSPPAHPPWACPAPPPGCAAPPRWRRLAPPQSGAPRAPAGSAARLLTRGGVERWQEVASARHPVSVA